MQQTRKLEIDYDALAEVSSALYEVKVRLFYFAFILCYPLLCKPVVRGRKIETQKQTMKGYWCHYEKQ
jgi:hypothetical protein